MEKKEMRYLSNDDEKLYFANADELRAFDERLIAEIKSRPVLYDIRLPENCSLKCKKKVWEEVGAVLGQEPIVCNRRWRKLRNNFRNAIYVHRNKDVMVKKEIFGDDALAFLLPFMNLTYNGSVVNIQEIDSSVNGPDIVCDVSKLEAELPEDLPTQSEENEQTPSTARRCGEIFMMDCESFFFVCTECDVSFKGFELFVLHLKTSHSTAGATKGEDPLEVYPKQVKVKDELIDYLKPVESDFDALLELEYNKTANNELGTFLELDEDLESENDERIELDEEIDPGDNSSTVDKTPNSTELETKSTKESKISNSHQLKPFKCDTCGKEFVFKIGLQKHKHSVHVPEKNKKFDCEVCGYRFQYRGALDEHLKRHRKEKPFKCDYCEKKFVSLGEKKKHHLTHTGEKPYVCEICGVSSTTLSWYYVHKRHHLGIKNFKCEICGKAFAKKGALREHTNMHTGEEPYSCPMCERTFRRYSALQQHKKLHTGLKTYICPICGKSFAQNPGLYCHMKSHNKL